MINDARQTLDDAGRQIALGANHRSESSNGVVEVYRELAHHIGTPPTSTNRELLKLAKAGVLLRERVGNRVHYRANYANPVFEELAGLLRKTAGIAAMLTAALQPLAEHIDCALVFGSVARGAETIYSDVDVLVLGSVGFAEVIEVLYPVQQYLKRDINPVVYKSDDFHARLAAGNGFVQEVVDKPKLFLIGSAASFAKPSAVNDTTPPQSREPRGRSLSS